MGMSRDPLAQLVLRPSETPDRRRAAQLALAGFALTQADPQGWLAEMLDILGLHTPPSSAWRGKNHCDVNQQ